MSLGEEFPWLCFIRERDGQRVHFWPFDGWDIPAGRSAIAEVYPALWSRSFAREDRNRDQHDAYCIAAWLSRADRDGSLTAFLNPDLSPPERTLAQVEGWILGVPGLIRVGGNGLPPGRALSAGILPATGVVRSARSHSR